MPVQIFYDEETEQATALVGGRTYCTTTETANRRNGKFEEIIEEKYKDDPKGFAEPIMIWPDGWADLKKFIKEVCIKMECKGEADDRIKRIEKDLRM